jgi:hypothetical protein
VVKYVCVDRNDNMAAGVLENPGVLWNPGEKGEISLLFDIVFPIQACQASFT